MAGALQTLNYDQNDLQAGPNLTLAAERGDTFANHCIALNKMLGELYNRTGGSAAASLSAAGLPSTGLQLPLTDAMTAAGVFLTATPGSGNFGVSMTAGTSVALTGESTSASSKTDTALLDLVLPPTYVAGQNLTVDVNCQSAGAGTITVETVNLNAYLVANAGTMGADLIGVSAQTITNAAADYAFTITGTGLVPGSHLLLKLVTVITTSAGAANSQINSLRVA